MSTYGALIMAAVLAALPTAGNAPSASSQAVFRVTDGRSMKPLELAAEVNGIELVFFGEVHGLPGHHRAQLELIKSLHEMDAPLSIALEMFETGSQEALDDFVEGRMPLPAFQEVFKRDWSAPWTLYGDIFLYAREHRIPLVALNVPQEVTRQVASGGFASLSPEQTAKLPGVSCRVDKAYEEFIRRVMADESHRAPNFRYFCEAQMVWDTAMANRLIEYAGWNPGRTVVVLAGLGHSWKHGIPAQIENNSGMPQRVILPEMPGVISREKASRDEADYLWLGITPEGRPPASSPR